MLMLAVAAHVVSRGPGFYFLNMSLNLGEVSCVGDSMECTAGFFDWIGKMRMFALKGKEKIRLLLSCFFQRFERPLAINGKRAFLVDAGVVQNV